MAFGLLKRAAAPVPSVAPLWPAVPASVVTIVPTLTVSVAAELVAETGDLAAIANPLSETFAVLRPSLVPGLAAAVAHNRRRQLRDVRLFEIGRAHV